MEKLREKCAASLKPQENAMSVMVAVSKQFSASSALSFLMELTELTEEGWRREEKAESLGQNHEDREANQENAAPGDLPSPGFGKAGRARSARGPCIPKIFLRFG